MKRFWLVLLSIGLIMAFSASAFAVDVKFSGSYYAAGMYVNRINLNDDSGSNGQSTAFYFQRLRVTTEFVVSPGLSLITRFDAMERVAGASRSAPNTTLGLNSAGTTAENENIAFDFAYIQYESPIGKFEIGQKLSGKTGTVFGDSSTTAFRVQYTTPTYNGMYWYGLAQKVASNRYTAFNAAAKQMDDDSDLYAVGVVYTSKSVNAGCPLYFYNYAATRTNAGAADYKRKSYQLAPFAIVKIGPVEIQAEIDYAFGKYKEYDIPGNTDVKANSVAGWFDAKATFGQFYFGGTFAYSQGQGTNADEQNLIQTGGTDWSPTLIMWNEDRGQWFGSLTSTAATTGFGTTGVSNAWFYQARVGVRPVEKLDICASLSFANADTTPAGYVSKDYGYEVDVTGTYKLTNNLTYMLGAGYLITGDFFKGTNSNNKVSNDYLITNKLTLTF